MSANNYFKIVPPLPHNAANEVFTFDELDPPTTTAAFSAAEATRATLDADHPLLSGRRRQLVVWVQPKHWGIQALRPASISTAPLV